MKSFKQIAEEYQDEIIEGAKLKKMKKWVPDEKGKLKRVLKKYCVDSDGQKAPGYKIQGTKCEKMAPSEIKTKQKASKKTIKTKQKHTSKNNRRAEKILKQKVAKGLIDPATIEVK